MGTITRPAADPARRWARDLKPGQAIELVVYGDRMKGRLQSWTGDSLRIQIPFAEQVAGLHLSTSHGVATVSIEGGAARLPVSCWTQADVVRLHVIGEVEYLQRRQFTRVPLDAQVTVTWPKAATGAWERVLVRAVDISLGGMHIGSASIVWPTLGSTVLLSVDLPGGPLQVEAEVLGKTPEYGLRLRFGDLAPAAWAALNILTGG